MKPLERTRAILRSGLDTESKIIAVALCDYMAADQGLAWPSVPTLVRDTGLGIRTVQRRLAAGVTAGWLSVREVPGKSNAYAVVFSELPVGDEVKREANRPYFPRHADTPPDTTSPVRETPPSERHPRHADTPPPSGRHPTPVSVTPPPPSGGRGKGPVEPTREVGGDRARANERTTPSPEPRADTARPRNGRTVDHATASLPPDAGPVLVAGHELPPDLPGLLYGATCGRVDVIRTLADAGLTTTERLLRLPRDRWQYTPKLGEVLAMAVQEHLDARWSGVMLGALAEDHGPPSRSGGPRRPGAAPVLTDAEAAAEAEVARIFALPIAALRS